MLFAKTRRLQKYDLPYLPLIIISGSGDAEQTFLFEDGRPAVRDEGSPVSRRARPLSVAAPTAESGIQLTTVDYIDPE